MNINNENIYLCEYCFSLLKISNTKCHKCLYINKNSVSLNKFHERHLKNKYENVINYLKYFLDKSNGDKFTRLKERNLIRYLKWVNINYGR